MKRAGHYIALYRAHLAGRGVKENPQHRLVWLERFMDAMSMEDIREMTHRHVEALYGYLKTAVNPYSKRALSETRVYDIMVSVRRFFGFLLSRDELLTDPFTRADIALKPPKVTREVFSREEMKRFLETIAVKDYATLRNRSLFELLYSSGLRISEALRLKRSDVNLKERVLRIEQGKGNRDRYVPFSDVARQYLEKYLKMRRKDPESKTEYVFYGSRKLRRTIDMVREQFAAYRKRCGITKRVVLHSIRHATATHLLEAGADVRYVQELLGHENIETTVRYTHMLEENLKRVYKRYHPRENALYEEVDEEYVKAVERMMEDVARQRMRWRD